MAAERFTVPLRMLQGNVEILLENRLPVEAISMRRDPDSLDGVVLLVHGVDKEVAAKLGFQTTSMMTTKKDAS